jgi:hypothetical protein
VVSAPIPPTITITTQRQRLRPLQPQLPPTCRPGLEEPIIIHTTARSTIKVSSITLLTENTQFILPSSFCFDEVFKRVG